MDSFTLLHGDCLEEMAAMDAGSVDAVCCDPPYGLEFMGKEWDKLWSAPDDSFKVRPKGGTGPFDRKRAVFGKDTRRMQEWHEAWATEALRVLKPSHYLLAFGGTRTWHRLACAIEDAGFEIRDTLMWLYGSGFPKGKASLKPAWEPIILARKPGPMRELGIDGCRIGWATETERAEVNARTGPNSRHIPEPVNGVWPTAPGRVRSRDDLTHPSGRWPANLILECTCDETREGTAHSSVGAVKRKPGQDGAAYGGDQRPEGTKMVGYGKEPVRIHTDPNCPCAMLDGQTGTVRSSCNMQRSESRGGEPGFIGGRGFAEPGVNTYSDSGGASRFFYCSKASRSERNAGCEGMEERLAHDDDWVSRNRLDQPCAGKRSPQGNHHPTVKPLALMRWLVKLVAQPGDVVLDPFAGSGTTGVACVMEGREFIGIERDAEYVEIARRRIEHASAQGRLPLDESPPLGRGAAQ